MDFDYNMTKETIAKTFITNQTNGEDTKVRIEKYCDCLWIFFGEKDIPDVIIDAVDEKLRVGIYPEDDTDVEPDMYVLKTVSGAW